MKVRCVKRINPITGKQAASDSWLTIGRSYVVLSVSIELRRGISYRIIANDNTTPALFDSRQFEIVDPKIPSNWAISVAEGRFILSPLAWTRRGFWEDFFNSNVDAMRAFEEGKRAIMLEEELK
jgi:hypothetical protein